MLEALQQELSALERFVALLQQEQDALVAGNVDALLALSQDKLGKAEQLNALGKQRVTRLQQAGYSGDSAGMTAWLDDKPAIQQQTWERLLELAREAQRLNQTNGKLIQTHLQHNQQALNTLLGAANQAGTYGADGQARATMPGTSRTIGKV